MTLSKYFETAIGRGILATADAEGRVDAAVYARPHVLDEETVAFIMIDRLTHKNLQSNPHAAFLFMEDGPKYSGKRLLLTKIKEEKGGEMLESLRRKAYADLKDKVEYLVHFHIDKVLPLIGSDE